MALIKCPECGKEVSNKAPACIHCGYPLNQTEISEEKKSVPNIDGFIQNIQLTANSFMSNPNLYGRSMGGIYSSVKAQIDYIYNTVVDCEKEGLREVNDKVALTILDITRKGDYFCTWKTYKNFYSFVRFDNISDSVMRSIVDFIYEQISYNASDGTGNCEHIKLWYPIYQVLTNVTEELKRPILEVLSLPNAFGNKKYDNIESMARQHLYEDSSEIVRPKTNSYTSTAVNVPKCPTCGSTDIEKISGLSKVASVALWGVFSQKVHKQWCCNNCGNEW